MSEPLASGRSSSAPSGRILVTGVAGFIGMHVAKALLAAGQDVVGVDNLNTYYDPGLKAARLAAIGELPGFAFQRLELADRAATERLFQETRPRTVIHLAAQAGVRYSLENPAAYVDSNLVAFANILEGCRHSEVSHLVYASSSSVYGSNRKMPFAVGDPVDHPVSLYAATKKANELMAHTYSHLFGLPTTGLRFFTVYGPWGRPDMAPMLFTDAIIAGRPIDVFNEGRMSRDFTYIDDVVTGVLKVADRPPASGRSHEAVAAADGFTTTAPYRVYNIGNNQPVALMEFIETLERAIGKTAIKRMKPMQPGDVEATYADISDLEREFDYRPDTSLADGIAEFIAWYRDYFLAVKESPA
ncbi:MAG: NAD-dependent epimerase [Hyphomicrobiaceae bacterium]|nr:NAD-dependent epimerase [Hyphomicrobiaceae bacterium]